MEFLAHRGIWKCPTEKNTMEAFNASFDSGIGVETDVRDCDGRLVISHDPPCASDAITFDLFLDTYLESQSRPVLALNVKSDGLQKHLQSMLQCRNIENYFVFDMSIPDTLGYAHLGMQFAARLSEYEKEGRLTEMAQWIWLDAFHSEWFEGGLINKLLSARKKVVIVSPELHKRPHLTLWESIFSFKDRSGIFLCTDLVDEAKEFFNAGKN